MYLLEYTILYNDETEGSIINLDYNQIQNTQKIQYLNRTLPVLYITIIYIYKS